MIFILDMCVNCGKYVPEGRDICPVCEKRDVNHKNPKLNQYGYPDPTAYEGLKPIIKEDNYIERRANQLIKCLKFIIDWAGFDLISRIELRDKKSGREFR